MGAPRKIHYRKRLRLQGRNYGQEGYYFVTFATRHLEHIFGQVKNGELILNEFGRIAQEEWLRAARVRKHIELDAFVIMPNHIHGLIFISCTSRKPKKSGARSGSIGAIIGQFKSLVSKRVNEIRKTPGAALWHRGFYERVIRNEKELDRIRRYIQNNPKKWSEDRLNKNPLKTE